MNIIFLDIDGVLNCQVFYDRVGFTGPERENNICTKRVSWLNELCEDVNAKVVISSSWRHSGLEHCKERLKLAGATFDIIDITGSCECRIRGVEIREWLIENAEKLSGIKYYDFDSYVIIDDDSDMLLWQQHNFFHVDSYAGLTPNTCYKIKNFFTKKESFKI